MKLNPDDASDSNGDLDADGYTNIEEYLHSLPGHGGRLHNTSCLT